MSIPKFLLNDFEVNPNETKQGNQACVFKGNHPVHREVAIKQYRKGYCDKEVTILMQNVSHQNIIKFIGILINEQSRCIGYIMPYMENGSLYDVIHNESQIYEQKEVNSWIIQICCGLSYLHSKQIIHRGVKPKNILLGKSYDEVKLSDFGISRSLDNTTHSLTAAQGTSLYMAPEIFKGQNYTVSADIYSLSITIWEILHRRIPYDHIVAGFELHNKISSGERPELNNNLPKEMSRMLKSCWHVDASLRPTINEVLAFSRDIGFLFIGNVAGKEAILLVGGSYCGKHLDSLQVLQNDGDQWKQLDFKLPYTICSHGAQFLSNHLYIFGGKDENNKDLSSTCKLSKSLQWENMAEMKEKRSCISNSSAILNNKIWVIGGWNGNKALKNVEMYDPTVNKWNDVKETNESRAGAAVTAGNGKIFCCGGWNGKIHVNSAEYYDPSSDMWTLICDMPRATAGCGAAIIDGSLIVVGGFTGEEYLNNVSALDTTNEHADWIDKPSMPFERSDFSIATIGDKMFICGGEHKEDSIAKTLDDVDIFDGQIWKNGPKLVTPQEFAAATAIPIDFANYLK